ncbi:MAG: riboflavin synthase [Planctomycetes bacterium]|nr:riboflavin synthase [Planctomycetota bacterium]
MFSGIVEHLGTVTRFASASGDSTGARRLELDAGDFLADAPLGASVAINGVCLTIAGRRGSAVGFDVVPETLRCTNLGLLQGGDRVNLERSLRVGDRIDGHFVQGHVDGTAVVRRNGAEDGQWKLWIELPESLVRFAVSKGSIAIDGVSLTLVDVRGALVSVALIPTTLERTVLGIRRPGDRVNIETDILARIVVSRLEAAAGSPDGGITIDRLRAAGFAP